LNIFMTIALCSSSQ